MFTRSVLTLVCAALLSQPCLAADWEQFVKSKGRKVLFLGDSNTFAGLYIAYVEGYLLTRFPDQDWDLINLGLPSETVSGLSEPDHPYPRPDIHERVDRALAKIKPNIVFVCYGMNDGIYYPYSERRLAHYRKGIQQLIAKIEKAGARAILMTPAPFDGTPIGKNLLPEDAPKFSWIKPYRNYDQEVLRKYSDDLLELRKFGGTVIDAHAATHRFLKVMRMQDPKYVVSGDGIHPNATGHAVIAFEILRELKVPAEVQSVEVDFKAGKATRADVTVEAKGDSVILAWKALLPMPGDPRWDQGMSKVEPYESQFNRQTVKITGLPVGAYEIVENKAVIGTATNEELAKGISLTSFKDFSRNVQSQRLGKLIQERQQIMGLAWLTDIGYKRPGTPKGLSLDEAAQRTADQRQAIRRMIMPERVELTFRRKE